MTSYRNERVVGHSIHATLNSSKSVLHDVAASYGIEPMNDGYIQIVEGDVSWDSAKSIRISKDELREMADTFLDE